jgi:hypothetical protein
MIYDNCNGDHEPRSHLLNAGELYRSSTSSGSTTSRSAAVRPAAAYALPAIQAVLSLDAGFIERNQTTRDDLVQ